MPIQKTLERELKACANYGVDAAGGCTEAPFLPSLQLFDLPTLRGFLVRCRFLQDDCQSSGSGSANPVQD